MAPSVRRRHTPHSALYRCLVVPRRPGVVALTALLLPRDLSTLARCRVTAAMDEQQSYGSTVLVFDEGSLLCQRIFAGSGDSSRAA
jgi:hypothetical protein